MSTWSATKKEDMEIDGNEINVCIGADNHGNIYIIIKISDLMELIGEHFKK